MKDIDGGRAKADHRFLTGNFLKGAGTVSMVIDHLAAVVLKGYVNAHVSEISQAQLASLGVIYDWMRRAGRMAFPLFAFLLVEGFFHTRDRRRYGRRMLFCALFSEIPYDLAFYGKIWAPQRQNVLVTLFLGLVCMGLAQAAGRESIKKKRSKKGRAGGGRRGEKRTYTLPAGLRFLIQCMIFLAGAGIAGLCRSDYSYKGILLIAVFYFFHFYQEAAAVAGFCAFFWSPWSFPAFLLLPFYGEKRGKGRGKGRLFYLFYPLHLLAMYGILYGLFGGSMVN